MPHLFVYGSLQFPELVTALTGEQFRYVPVTLNGFERGQVKGCDYPGIVKQPNAKTEGFLIEDVDEKSMQILTFFEGDDYEKQQVTVFNTYKKISAFTFVWIGGNNLLENTDWNADEFKNQSLKIYLNKVVPETLVAFAAHNL